MKIAAIFLACALSQAPTAGWRPPLTLADQDFMSFMRAMSIYDIAFIHKKTAWEYFTQTAANTRGGGVLFIEFEFGKLDEYFRGREWERFPFKWRDYYIYRRRGGSAA